MLNTATTIVIFCFCAGHGIMSERTFTLRSSLGSCVEYRNVHTVAYSDIKKPTSSDVQPSINRPAPTKMEPPVMKGRLLPYFDVERSDRASTTGCMIRPERGPAIHTKEVRD